MSKSNNSSTSIGCGGFFSCLLAVAFIVLKLTHYIDWSWWWVLSPLWIYVALVIVVVIFALIVLAIVQS